MSLLRKYLKGWSFRTTHPTFAEGDEISVFLTGHENGAPIARIGDTKLRVSNVSEDLIDSRVRLRITQFDENDHTGEAEFLEKVGESAF